MKIEAWRDGRPVVHFLQLITQEDEADCTVPYPERVTALYRVAVNKAAPFGGERFHNRGFGGGVIFPSETDIIEYEQKKGKQQ